MKPRKSLTAAYEQQKIREGFSFVVGCDEVGRGCLAGLVVAASVILGFKFENADFRGINDSKSLSREQREKFDLIIRERAIGWGIGVVSEKIIDKINIHQASLLAMRKAVENMLVKGIQERKKYFLVLDGKFIIPSFHMQQEAVINGDAKIFSIAAASIVAKVYRDKLMMKLHKKYPLYGFDRHKGYVTFHHRKALEKIGLSQAHRRSFCKKYSQ